MLALHVIYIHVRLTIVTLTQFPDKFARGVEILAGKLDSAKAIEFYNVAIKFHD